MPISALFAAITTSFGTTKTSIWFQTFWPKVGCNVFRYAEPLARYVYMDLYPLADLMVISRDLSSLDLAFKGLTDLSRLRVKVGAGRSGFAEYVKIMHSFLSNYHIEVEDIVAEKNKVFCRTVVSGIHRGQFMGYAPTLKQISWAGCALFTFDDDGLIKDIWALNDDSELEETLKTNKSIMHT